MRKSKSLDSFDSVPKSLKTLRHSLQSLRGQQTGKLNKLPLLGCFERSTNFEWCLFQLNSDMPIPKPDVRLQALSSEWCQSLTRIQLHFSGGSDSTALQAK